MDYPQDHIRNFAITAHIDHGKTTLSDRILEMTGAVQERELSTQMLDDLPLEQRRGITVKLNAVNLKMQFYWLTLLKEFRLKPWLMPIWHWMII